MSFLNECRKRDSISLVDTEHFPEPGVGAWCVKHRNVVIQILKERNEISAAEALALKAIPIAEFRAGIEIIEERLRRNRDH